MEISVIILIVLGICAILGLLFFFISQNKKKQSQIEIQKTDSLPTKSVEKETVLPKENLEIKKDVIQPILNETLFQKPEISFPEEDENQVNLSISSKTEKALLKKLELFEKNKGFVKKDVNLTTLAKQFETNTKYLSEIIKTYRQKQFNTYLNDLRIHYIVDRLQNEPKYINTKISYLASDCGFTSHSTFTTIFTQIMNESPSVFIKRVKAEQKA